MAMQYEEYRTMPVFWSWMLVVVFCLAIIGWGLTNYLLIPDAPRQWDTGAHADVPGQSIYSTTAQPGSGPAPRQIEPPPMPPTPAPASQTGGQP